MRREVRLPLFGIVMGVVSAAGCGSSPEATIVPPTAPPPSSTIAAGLPIAPAASSTAPAMTAEPTTTITPAADDAVATTAPPPPRTAPATTTVSTRPATTTTAATSDPTAGGALLPAFFAFEVSEPGPCAESAPTVTLRWEVIGTESVDIAIGTVDAVHRADLSPAGSLTVPHPCPGPVSYFVVAENPDGRSVREATR